MCIYKNCPIYDVCEKEVDQVLYCRHVEMIKKIGQMRQEMKKKQAVAKNSPDQVRIVGVQSEARQSPSELFLLQRIFSDESH